MGVLHDSNLSTGGCTTRQSLTLDVIVVNTLPNDRLVCEYLCTESSCIDCNMAERFSEKTTWCLIEQVCQGVKFSVLSNPKDLSKIKFVYWT